ncbi:unnamed protein product [Caenorhabditis nigoni]
MDRFKCKRRISFSSIQEQCSVPRDESRGPVDNQWTDSNARVRRTTVDSRKEYYDYLKSRKDIILIYPRTVLSSKGRIPRTDSRKEYYDYLKSRKDIILIYPRTVLSSKGRIPRTGRISFSSIQEQCSVPRDESRGPVDNQWTDSNARVRRTTVDSRKEYYDYLKSRKDIILIYPRTVLSSKGRIPRTGRISFSSIQEQCSVPRDESRGPVDNQWTDSNARVRRTTVDSRKEYYDYLKSRKDIILIYPRTVLSSKGRIPRTDSRKEYYDYLKSRKDIILIYPRTVLSSKGRIPRTGRISFSSIQEQCSVPRDESRGPVDNQWTDSNARVRRTTVDSRKEYYDYLKSRKDIILIYPRTVLSSKGRIPRTGR